MTPRLLILGAGKMGRDIGAHFLQHGFAITWLEKDAAARAALETFTRRLCRRMELATGVAVREGDLSFFAPGDTAAPPAEVVIECLPEDAPTKCAALAAVAPSLRDGAMLLSNSSSILPQRLHPRCVGFHCFYPLALTRLVEIVTPADADPATAERVIALARDAKCAVIAQGAHNAFAVNRLLLPLQAEAARALQEGYSPEVVNRASAFSPLPMGQLQMMDAIGLDVVDAAVCNYLKMLPPSEARDYSPLASLLSEALAAGKLGQKNGHGLLNGEPFVDGTAKEATPLLLRRCFLAFLNAVCVFPERGLLDAAGLNLAFDRVWHADESADDFRRREFNAENLRELTDLYRETGLSYFAPNLLRDTFARGAAE